MSRTSDPSSPIVVAHGIGVRTSAGSVFESVGFEAPAGSLTCVAGPGGSGRTSLLLALTGRMRITEGFASVAGHRLPGQERLVRRITGLGVVRGVNSLDPALSLDDHVRTEALLAGRRLDRRQRLAVLDATGVMALPGTRLRDASADDVLRAGIALALIRRPRLVAVDDVDRDLTAAEQRAVWRLLADLAGDGLTVVASAMDTTAVPAEVAVVRLGAAELPVAVEVTADAVA